MAHLLDKTMLIISQLYADEDAKKNYKDKAKRLFNECGCSMGAIFLAAAILGSIGYLLFLRFNIRTVISCSVIVFLTAITGKLIGISFARVRLFFLYKGLSKELHTKKD